MLFGFWREGKPLAVATAKRDSGRIIWPSSDTTYLSPAFGGGAEMVTRAVAAINNPASNRGEACGERGGQRGAGITPLLSSSSCSSLSQTRGSVCAGIGVELESQASFRKNRAYRIEVLVIHLAQLI